MNDYDKKPYLRPDFATSGEDEFDEYSQLLVNAYYDAHGRELETIRHQLESYEYFIKTQQEETIQSMNPIFIKCEDDFISTGKYKLELRVYFEKLKSELPKVQEQDGELKLLFPSEARVRNISYMSRQT